MGHADRLTQGDLGIAIVRNMNGAKLTKDQMQYLAHAFARVVGEFYQANQDLFGTDKAAELADECALTIENCYPIEPSAEDIAADRAEAKYEAKRDAALIGG